MQTHAYWGKNSPLEGGTWNFTFRPWGVSTEICSETLFYSICGQGLKIYISAWQVGHTVAQLAETLCYKQEGHEYPDGISDVVIGIIHWCNPSGYTMALGVNSASNRCKYQEYFLGDKGGRCVGLTALPPSCADCLVNWEPQPPGTLRACIGIAVHDMLLNNHHLFSV
jgi:hypothetical protein